MIKLEGFTKDDFNRLISWFDSEEELLQFAGPIFSYPLTNSQLEKHLENEKIQIYKIISGEEVIGHCEFNFEDKVPRLSRILIGDKSKRGQGLGRVVVQEMVEKLFEDNEIDLVDLRVFEWNIGARKCYENVGFEIDPEGTVDFDANGENWVRLRMEITRNDWENK